MEKYENIDGHFHFFEAYAHFSPLYQQVGKRLLSMKSVGSMDVKRMAIKSEGVATRDWVCSRR